MQLITGNTYPVKDQLKALGARWNAADKGWVVSDDRAEAARAIVSGRQPSAGPAGAQRAPGMASDKQIQTIRKMLRRVEKIRDFDSFSMRGDEAAESIEKEMEALGGYAKLSSKQASVFIGTLIDWADDEM
jgi:hypothetical protein